jgi:hypothetical protein
LIGIIGDEPKSDVEIAEDSVKHEHARRIVRASLRLGPSRVGGFGDYVIPRGMPAPDILVAGGLKTPNAQWVEVTERSVGRNQLGRTWAANGPGEYAFCGWPGSLSEGGLGILSGRGIRYWYAW